MSIEYEARMEVLQRKREELTAQRQAIEKRLALREATAAEFSAVALQSCRQKWKAQRSAVIAAKKRNDEFIRTLQETQKQVHDTWSRLQSDQSSSNALLKQEKARYNRRVEQIYPAWQEQLQRQRVQKLRELEDKKKAVERRRYLAKKSFEKEQTLDDLIQKTRHEVEMAENLEQNELYERELLRTQSTNQAKEVDQSIREVALEARGYLQQQAAKHFEATPELDEELAGKLSETFSPRHALRALQEGSSSLAFEDNQQYEEEKPLRQIRVEIPARMNSPTRFYYPETNQQDPNRAYSADMFEDENIHENQELYENPARFTPALNERHQTSLNAGNVYHNVRHSRSIDHSAVEPRDLSNRSAIANFIPASGQTPIPSEVSRVAQQSAAPANYHAYNEDRGEAISQPRDNIKVLPSLVAKTLYPIAEANEPLSVSATSTRVPDKVNAQGLDTTYVQDRGNVSTGGDHRGSGNSTTIHVAVASRTNLLEPPVSTPQVKIEEHRVASSLGRPVTMVPIGDTMHSQVEVDQPVEHQGHAIEPEPLIKESKTPEPQTTSILQPKDYSASTPSILKRSPTDVWNGDLRSKTEDKSTSPDSKAPVDEHEITSRNAQVNDINDISLGVDSGSTSSEANGTNTSAPVFTVSEGLVETKEIGAEANAASENIVASQVASRTSSASDAVNVHEGGQGLGRDNANKMDSLHGTDSALDKMNANLLTTETFASEAAETTVEVVQDIVKSSTKVPNSLPPAISYRMDLLEPFAPSALTPVNKLLAEDDMLLTSMHSDDFDLSPKNAQPCAEKPPLSNTDDMAVRSDFADVVDSVATPPEAPIPAVEEVNTRLMTEKLSPVDRVKALGALISRVEEGATEGDTLGGSTDTESSYDSKRELLKMAVGGRKAQIAFFGSDICFELILDISRDLGPGKYFLEAMLYPVF